EKAAAGEYLTKHGLLPEFVIIHPGSKGSAWNISRQKYAEAADAVSTFAKVLLTGGPAEKAMLMSIMDSMKNGENVVVMEEEMTLRQFAAVISLSSVLVSCSTGPMHLAAAMGVKTLSFFPHDGIRAMRVKRWGPIGNINEIIMPAESRLAPDDAMDTIPVGLIADKVRNLLAR
ncbi:MAG TPA: glycosyltransferase family 9 protein, partial [Candidatus Goldiibacteriota bacterium]|nr:glycosyltransferase family 9 protein [Candidatus Goldiibacteriota bacterium]